MNDENIESQIRDEAQATPDAVPELPVETVSDGEVQTELHRLLARFNRRRLKPNVGDMKWTDELDQEFSMRQIEISFIEDERAQVQHLLKGLPTDADGFMAWFERLRDSGPGQGDSLFPWLAEQADMASMRWFLHQEVAGEAGFDDLVAMSQVRLPTRPKLEMARNYWDEMGRGHEKGMHGPMLERLAVALQVQSVIEETVWESLALGNLMAGMACNRRYAYQSVGALGVIEMTAPGRVSKVNEGLTRLGVGVHLRRYFQLHAGLDIRHSEAWNREVIRPLVASDPRLAHPLAEGALMRLNAGARCFERYRKHLLARSQESAVRRRSKLKLVRSQPTVPGETVGERPDLR